MKKLLSVLVLAAAVCCAGVVLAEEAVIEGPILTYQIEDWDWMIPPYVKGAITLTEGWNLIAIPVIPQQPVTVETFSKMVAYSDEPIYKTDPKLPDDNFIQAKRSSWQVRAVAVYKDGRFRVYPKEGVTYNMVPGEAYFVYAEYHGLRPAYSELIANPPPGFEPWHPKTTVTIVGKSVNASVSLDLNKGWNGAALMLKQKPYYDFDMPITKLPRIPFLKVDKSDSDISNAQFPIDEGKIFGPINIGSSLSQLSRELVEQGVKAKRIVFWNAENQAWDQYELPRPEPVYRHIPGLWDLGVELGGVDEYTVVFDPGINADQGFFLLCEENGLYIPGLRQIQKPPYPPFPPIPQRVYYSGTIERRDLRTIPENFFPYDFVLTYFKPIRFGNGDATGNALEKVNVPLKGANEDIESQLAELADSAVKSRGAVHSVEGVMKTLRWTSMLPPYGGDVDVLIVEGIDLNYIQYE